MLRYVESQLFLCDTSSFKTEKRNRQYIRFASCTRAQESKKGEAGKQK